MDKSKGNFHASSNESMEEIYGNEKKKKGVSKKKDKADDLGLWTRVVRMNDDGL